MLLWMDFANRYLWACLFITVGFGLIGFLDDYDKVTKRSHKGVSGRVRLLGEFIIAGIAAWIIVQRNGTHLYLPFFSGLYRPRARARSTSCSRRSWSWHSAMP